MPNFGDHWDGKILKIMRFKNLKKIMLALKIRAKN